MTKPFDPEYDIIDLEPYIKGERKMFIRCWGDGCKEKIDITKDFIIMEKQNNIRKKAPRYDPACDQLVIYGRACPKHARK